MKHRIIISSALALSVLLAVEYETNCVQAKTVVTNNRHPVAENTHHNTSANPDDSLPSNTSNESVKDKTDTQKVGTDAGESEASEIKGVEAPAVKDKGVGTNAKPADYFSGFTGEPPKISTAIISNNTLRQSVYERRNPLTDEIIVFTVYKIDKYLSFTFSWNLKVQPLINKKHCPVFEISENAKVSCFEFPRLDSISTNSFDITTRDLGALDRVFESDGEVILILDLKDGSKLRIPIPREVVSQWRDVRHTDLRKARQEYDDQ